MCAETYTRSSNWATDPIPGILDWTGLDWTGLDWTGLDWTGTRELATEYIIRYQTTAACLFSPLVFYPRQ